MHLSAKNQKNKTQIPLATDVTLHLSAKGILL